jgi:hypothetical protein
VKKISRIPRFEVDFKTRLKQSRKASDAVRLPRLGYSLYRVYDIEKPKETKGVRLGPVSIISNGSNTGNVYYQQWQQVLWAFVDEFESCTEPPYQVRWLKPKHATMLRMKGHRVELAHAGDKSNKIQGKSGPVRLGV